MILSDREIRIAMKRGLLRIVPEPMAEAWSSTAVDLRLAPVLRRWNPTPDNPAMGVEHRFRPAHPEFNFSQIAQQFTEEITISPAGYNLEPNRFILG
jgi:deoxycytidine triphosphate deaminase